MSAAAFLPGRIAGASPRIPSPVLRRSASRAGPATAPAVVHDVLRSPGQPLDAGTRAYMEPRFGHSFADVRVHADGAAADSARAVGARAYAVGSNVVFGGGAYAPGSTEGRRLIAHELAHVVQQSASTASPPTVSRSLEVGAVDAPEEREADAAAQVVSAGRAIEGGLGAAGAPALRRTPGTDAADSWTELGATVEADGERSAAANEAVRRMMATASGAELVNSLWRAFCGRGRCRTRITVRFMDRLPPDAVEAGAAGQFSPPDRGAARYTVLVRNELPDPHPHVPQRGDHRSWPGDDSARAINIDYTHTDPASTMADTLYHELLHVWYVNTQHDTTYPTGHDDVRQAEISPVFLGRLRSFAAEMDALETSIHAEQAAAEAEVERRRAEAEAARRPAAPPAAERREEHPATPSIVGGEVSVQVGGAGGSIPAAFTGIVGADLILGNIHSLRIGARGIYLTPDHLFTGGTLGYRILQSDGDGPGSRVERPFFFDVEAGLLHEVTPAAATRFSDSVVGYGGVGVGQEMGTSGARFFWRVGGFVMISDRPAPTGASGGGAAAS
ncbi:MAG: hypothetical protein JWM27_3615, partial [Gemmatimonadetes bacterium]|nr:hypothetical protein [Gemmatimonadota bacterium]